VAGGAQVPEERAEEFLRLLEEQLLEEARRMGAYRNTDPLPESGAKGTAGPAKPGK
jgi:hypothetical protein